MAKKVGAILLDTRSIQKYVFSCNKLKTNVGASYLVDGIFNDLMQNIILPKYNLKMPDISWKKSDGIQMIKDNTIKAEIVYIGGGNMLILINKFLKEEDNLKLCRDIVSSWSLEILKKAPGLKTGAAIGMMDVSEDAFKDSLDDMYVQLKQNQNTVLPQVDLPYTGLTLECDISGKTADTFDWVDKKWIAKEVKAKTEAYKYASEKVRYEYGDILNNEYDFASELEKIGCKEGESYISVIHIDGNNMGVKFSKCKDSQERKKLSLTVVKIVQNAFRELIQSIIDEYDSKAYDEALDKRDLIDDKGKKLLPIRPIIIGGDDITFVCPARVGIEYAKRFIEAVNKQDFLNDEQYKRMSKEIKEEKKDNESMKISKTMSCCGGVAIVPLKYPFFRAYQLAEHLCGSAKTKSRQDDSSLIDFAILYGEMTPSLEQLCRYQYVAPEGYLHYGPYYIKKNSDEDIADKSSIKDLLSLKDKLKARVASNKIKELRDVLTRDLHAQIRFLENCESVRDIIKEESNTKDIEAKAFWQKKDKEVKTRYVDAIEIIDFTLPNKED
ncbi:Cas10/Cmr2 second palm domain-containing protein [Megamonas hypermegale]|uniref:Cas10/Cmr2 second palm domain-containing protein n=1 Tax=Megamonas hypermegale TaxID=158847 RepID=UPI00195E21CB|nr:hypothetical protein [Megamonas hypermegale]MBM6761963.1 hypothetical protein [Megamonas hypermegale]